jgi:hypothetical protein
MTIEVNRFSELVDAIRKIADPFRNAAIAGEGAKRQSRLALEWLIEFSPEAIPGRTLITTGHHHETIVRGWRGPFTQLAFDGAESTITNVSEHIEVQRYGTRDKDYIIPLGRRSDNIDPYARDLVFWLGPPLIWPVQVPRLRGGDFVYMRLVRHPGLEPHGGKDFVESAADQARPGMVEFFRETGMEIAFKPLEDLLQ